VEIWLEKDALAGVLIEETDPWDVPLMVTHGFPSISYVYEAAEALRKVGKPAFLYYFGDRDPSGVHIDRSLAQRLREFAPDAEIHFERLAVTLQQITDWDLPTRPTKTGSTHARGFEGDSVEVDAIPGRQLRQMVRKAIEWHIDQEVLARLKKTEELERQTLEQMAQAQARKGGKK
jgi:hypothetical protein